MFRYLFILLLLAISLYALDDDEILKRADDLMQTNNKSNQFRAYNDYKNLYIRSIMSEDEKLKLKALQGIVNSGGKLHIDVANYTDELAGYATEKKLSSIPKVQQSYDDAKAGEKIALLNTPTKKQGDIQIASTHKLQSVRWQDENMILSFDKVLKQNQINYSALYDKKQNTYRYIFDIHASMLSESQNLRKEGIGKIRLAQFDQNMLRLVIENDSKLELNYKVTSDKIVINVPASARAGESEKITAVSSPTAVMPRGLAGSKTVVIDPGHGGKDPGAISKNKAQEKTIVLDIASELKKILIARGYKVYMTRDSDQFVKLSHRTQFANKKNADIFVSIHANAVEKANANKANGIECYFLSNSRSSRAKKVAAKENSADLSDMNFYGKESFLNTLNKHNIVASNKLAIDLQRGMLSSLSGYNNVNDAGVREGPFWVLVGAQMPSVLVEVGFLSHPIESTRLLDRRYQKSLALGIANGVERYFLNN
ncbi:MAG TPA: N-acetylmuramoyl-L-alanine amidase [Sulfurimonas sp. UBA12504]|nr:MAG: N-acetylmuramoyl-L-alanine amidase [Sulfurimonas sp. GWF2_37_8]DAB30592.1 MAG TPA: N-acetylmuramoyl-L-alanine amidase [Sulfurimonas sp. UBA12504]